MFNFLHQWQAARLRRAAEDEANADLELQRIRRVRQTAVRNYEQLVEARTAPLGAVFSPWGSPAHTTEDWPVRTAYVRFGTSGVLYRVLVEPDGWTIRPVN